MRIWAISLIKNEVDIIEYSLNESLKWAHKIFVYDNGSTDGTWELVQEMAKKDDRIVAWKSEDKPYTDGLRADVYNEFKHHAKKGDWWCFILDSDELYIDEPKKFLSSVPGIYQVVGTERFEYELTHEDLAEHDFTGEFIKDKEHIKYYRPKTHTEKRFFRHRSGLVWTNDRKYPKHIGVPYDQFIRAKHFHHRSPQQLQKRIIDRKRAMDLGYKFFKKDQVEDWKEKIMDRSQLIRETPEFKREKNRFELEPWYWRSYRIIMHSLGIFP